MAIATALKRAVFGAVTGVLGLWGLGSAASSAAEPLTQQHYLGWERAGGAQIAPDGSEIIYTRASVDRVQDKFTSELWIMDSDGGRHRFLAKGSDVQWSPSGDRIAFIGEDGQIHVRWMDAEGATSRITQNAEKPGQIRWSPDGRQIAFRARVPSETSWKIELPERPDGAEWTEDSRVIETLDYRRDRIGFVDWHHHLFVVPADGGTPRQLTEGPWDVSANLSGFDWTPDGQALVFAAHIKEAEELPELRTDLHLVDLASEEITTLKDDGSAWSGPQVSPDGQRIAYSGGNWEGVNGAPTAIRIMNRDGGGDRAVLEDLPSGLSLLRWTEDGRGLYYAVDHQGRTDLFYSSLDGSVRQISGGMHRFWPSSVSGNGMAAGTYSAPTVPRAVATVRLAARNAKPRVLTDLNADILYNVDLVQLEEIVYDSYDGLEIQGWIMKPPGFDPEKEYPLHLIIHGGPESMYGVNFNYYFQWFAAQGYVVLFTNPRGSTGYGTEFMQRINNQYPGEGDFQDLMHGVDEVISRGFIDEDRLYASGCSGGGVLTSWIVTQTDRFAAAAALCPVTNWISFGGTADINVWAMTTRFQTPFWEDPTDWLEHSPIMHVGKVKTPTLLMTGDLDLRTPIDQAEEFYAALKLRGVPTKLISVKDEYHGTVSIPSNMLRTQLYLTKWFEEHGGGAAPDDDDQSDEDGSMDNK